MEPASLSMDYPLSPAFQIGTIVQDFNTKEIFLIAEPYKEWSDHFRTDLFSNTTERVLNVYSLQKNVKWFHEHISPLYLTRKCGCTVLKTVSNSYQDITRNQTIYQAPSEKAALEQLERVTEKWEKEYPNAMKSWHTNWDVISPIFKFSVTVRKVIYTTNAIESLIAPPTKRCQKD